MRNEESFWAELERQLLADLNRNDISAEGLRFDWSKVSQDGLFHLRQVVWQDEIYPLQEYDDLKLVDADGKTLLEGAYDFVYSGESIEDSFFVFWKYVYANDDADLRPLFDREFGIIPDFIWDQLSESNRRNVVNQWEQEWAKDPKVIALNQEHEST